MTTFTINYDFEDVPLCVGRTGHAGDVQRKHQNIALISGTAEIVWWHVGGSANARDEIEWEIANVTLTGATKNYADVEFCRGSADSAIIRMIFESLEFTVGDRISEEIMASMEYAE